MNWTYSNRYNGIATLCYYYADVPLKIIISNVRSYFVVSLRISLTFFSLQQTHSVQMKFFMSFLLLLWLAFLIFILFAVSMNTIFRWHKLQKNELKRNEISISSLYIYLTNLSNYGCTLVYSANIIRYICKCMFEEEKKTLTSIKKHNLWFG